MKTKYLYIILIIGIIQGCDKLDLAPVSQKSVSGFYKTETHINQAVIGLYNALRTAWVTSSNSYMYTEARSDNAFQGTAYADGPVSRFEDSPIISALSWASYYNYINRCNEIFENIDKVQMSDEKRRQFEGETRFARAMFYFDLVRLFGGVPLITKTISIDEGYKIPRASTEEIYDQIIDDLKLAGDLLPGSYAAADKGRATKWAAKGYLGKVYLFRSGYPLKKNEWNNAKQAFLEVISSGQFEFFNSYEDIYKHAFEGGKQQVFSIQFKSGASGNGNPFPTRNASNDIKPATQEQGGLPFGGSPFNLFLTDDLINSFEPNDKRKDVAILSTWLHKSGQMISTLPTCKKYQNGPVIAANDWDIDWIALSYTDILLMYAESMNEIEYIPNGEAFTILNNVRTRAGLQTKTAVEIPNQQSFRLWIEKERRHEFCFENIRWFDLVRTDRAFDVMKSFLSHYGMADNLKSKDQYFYPIPQTIIDVSPIIEQNPGY